MITLYIKGFLIGIGKIIPGVSGSLIACFLNVYDEALTRIKNISKNKLENINYFFPLFLGFISAIIVGSKVLQYFLSDFYIVTMMVIIIILILSLPTINKEKSINKRSIFITSFTLLMSIIIFNKNLNQKFIYQNDFSSNITVVFIGILESFSTIFPGISGTAIYMNLGCYDFVLDLFANMYKYVFENQFIIFSLSVIISFYILVLILNYLLKKHHDDLYSTILGFSIFSIYQLVNNINRNISIYILLIAFIYAHKRKTKT